MRHVTSPLVGLIATLVSFPVLADGGYGREASPLVWVVVPILIIFVALMIRAIVRENRGR